MDEYFKICKYTYMIRAIFAYNWKMQSDKPEVMAEMRDPDSTIFKLSKIVQNSIANVFEDTKPDQSVFDGNNEIPAQTQKSPKKRGGQSPKKQSQAQSVVTTDLESLNAFSASPYD